MQIDIEKTTLPKQNFGLGIVCYENCEFLFDICAELREICDFIVIGWQTISYSGKELDEELQKRMTTEFAFLMQHKLIDEVIVINNSFPGQNTMETTLNEKLKRNTIYLRLCDHGMDYCLIVDSDEFHFKENIECGLSTVIENGYVGSYVYTKNFIKDIHHEFVKENQQLVVNFIQSCKDKCSLFFYDDDDDTVSTDDIVVDFTRTFHDNSNTIVFDKTFPCYHFAYARDDIEEKISNYSQPSVMQNQTSVDTIRKTLKGCVDSTKINVFNEIWTIRKCNYPIFEQKLKMLKLKRQELENQYLP